MKVYGHPLSTCTRKVLMTLAEKGSPHEFVMVDIMKGEQKGAEHLARQPFGQIPVLEDGDFRMYESRAIARYLDETLPGPKLTPADAKGRAIMEQWISVETSNFTPHAMKIIWEGLFKKFQGVTGDEAVIQAGRTSISKTLDILNERLGQVPYLAGDDFTIADLGYMPYVEYLFAAGHGDLITSRPHVAAWWSRISARPSWHKATGKSAAA
ncbi:MAG: glutathione S-transferase N-terminal domain-containing protein [Polyangia bacterium]